MTAACPDPGRLAAAASGEDAAAELHAASCAQCGPVLRELIDTSRAIRAGVLVPPLSSARRDAIADGILVAVDAGVLAPPSRWRAAAIAIGIAAAAAIAIAVGVAVTRPAPTTTAAAPPAPAPRPIVEPLPAPDPAPVVVAPAPAPAPAHAPPVIAGDPVERAPDGWFHLTDGTVAFDTRASDSITVYVGATRIAVTGARVEIHAHRGVLAAVHVFSGSVEIAGPDRRTEVVAGEIWRAPAEAPPPVPAVAVSEVEWFRRGWVALRADHFADAAAAFDRATDPAVAEDAAFWAAVARERDGATGDARARFERFLATYPQSVHADAARQHLTALP